MREKGLLKPIGEVAVIIYFLTTIA